MMQQVKNFNHLLAHTHQLVTAKGKARVALIGANDALHLEAILRANEEGIIDPVLIGRREALTKTAEARGLDISRLTVINSSSQLNSIDIATGLAKDSRVDFFFRGNIATAKLLPRLFEAWPDFHSEKQLISHVAVFEPEVYPRLLLMSDGVVNVASNVERKLAIIQNAVSIANLLGMALPKVALLAAVEVIYPSMPVTVEAAAIAKMSDRGQIKNCLIDGPLSMDVATVPEVAEHKGAVSPVAGQADILIAPNIETGNGIYKAMAMFGKSKTAGVIIGGRLPIAMSSRCDSIENIFNSAVLGAFVSLSSKQK